MCLSILGNLMCACSEHSSSKPLLKKIKMNMWYRLLAQFSLSRSLACRNISLNKWLSILFLSLANRLLWLRWPGHFPVRAFKREIVRALCDEYQNVIHVDCWMLMVGTYKYTHMCALAYWDEVCVCGRICVRRYVCGLFVDQIFYDVK